MQLLECVLSWKQGLCAEGLPQCITAPGGQWTTELGQWLARMRLNGLLMKAPPPLAPADHQAVSELLCTLNLEEIAPPDVLLICLAGSTLYNLSLPTSDKDYIVVFRRPTLDLISSTNQPSVCMCVGGCVWGGGCCNMTCHICCAGVPTQPWAAAGTGGWSI